MTNEQNNPDNQNNQQQAMARRRSSPLVSLCLRIFLIVLAGFSVAILAFRIMEINELKQEEANMRIQLEQKQRELDELQYLVDAPVNEDYIVRVAREKLGLYYPDEILYYNDLNP